MATKNRVLGFCSVEISVEDRWYCRGCNVESMAYAGIRTRNLCIGNFLAGALELSKSARLASFFHRVFDGNEESILCTRKRRVVFKNGHILLLTSINCKKYEYNILIYKKFGPPVQNFFVIPPITYGNFF